MKVLKDTPKLMKLIMNIQEAGGHRIFSVLERSTLFIYKYAMSDYNIYKAGPEQNIFVLRP